jgi:manganese/iron transport system permease protein
MFREPFLQRAAIEVLLLSILVGVVGIQILLRRHAFVADALTHTMFPGIAIAFFTGGSLFVGALVAAAVSTVLLTVLGSLRRVDDDSVLALLVATFFAAGVVVVSRRPSFSSDLTSLLFGHLLTVDQTTIAQTAAVTVVVVLAVGLFGKELVFRAFDVEAFRALGYRVLLVDAVANLLTALVIVAAARAIGTALVVAILVTPAATARLLSDRVSVIMMSSVGIVAGGGLLGLAASYTASVDHGVRIEPGAAITVLLTIVFAVVAVVGLLRRPAASTGTLVPPDAHVHQNPTLR